MPRELASKTLTWKKMREVVGSTLWEMQNFVCHEKSVFSGDVALQQNNNDKKTCMVIRFTMWEKQTSICKSALCKPRLWWQGVAENKNKSVQRCAGLRDPRCQKRASLFDNQSVHDVRNTQLSLASKSCWGLAANNAAREFLNQNITEQPHKP